MKYTVRQIFNNLNRTCVGWSYQEFENTLKGLIYEMRNKIGHPWFGEQYLKFVMNIPFYREFCTACQMSCHDPEMYGGIEILLDSTLCIGNTQSSDGIVLLVYEEPIQKTFYDEIFGLDRGHGFQKVPHIDHVKFNGPATIVFWKDGTKTVVKHDGKGRKDKRQAILYAFIRKIYGEGRPYHNILNEIEEAVK